MRVYAAKAVLKPSFTICTRTKNASTQTVIWHTMVFLGTNILGHEREAEAVEAICGGMRNHPDDFLVQESGAYALKQIVCKYEEKRIRAICAALAAAVGLSVKH